MMNADNAKERCEFEASKARRFTMNTNQRWVRSVCGTLVCVAALAPDVQADQYFCAGTDNTWNDGSNWKSNALCQGADAGVPTAADKVTILSGKTCNVDVSAAVADHIVVESTATLQINTGNTLTLDGNGNSGVSTITGTVKLEGSSSTLAIVDNNQTFEGTGQIIGGDNGARITISAFEELTNETTIEGKLAIVPATAGQESTFTNEGTVHANVSGTLHVNTKFVGDSSGADRWKVSSSTSAILRFNPTDTTIPTIDGDLVVSNGTLDVDNKGFLTHGDLSMTGGTIDVASGALVNFSI